MHNIEECIVIEGNAVRIRVRRPYGEPDEWRMFGLYSERELPIELDMQGIEGHYLYSHLVPVGKQIAVFNVNGFNDGFGPYRETVHGPYLLRRVSVSSTTVVLYQRTEDGDYRLSEEYRHAAERGNIP
jgi:hypothetical protein